MFSSIPFSNDEIIEVLKKNFPDFTYRSDSNPIGIFGYIGDVKVDFVKYHRHPLIGDVLINEGVRLLSDEDLIAMKINAVLRRAVKKDFWDVAELLHYYPLEYAINCYNQKFNNQQLPISIPYALTYFNDAEESEDPISLKGQTWEAVKKGIQAKVRDFLS